MQNAVSIYNFNENQVRTQLINGEPWFCLSDCCKALNIKNQQTSVKLPENGVGKTYLIDSMGRQQSATFINEPNLYRLIFRSNKPQAQAFADWVYSEVLPSIRKTGSYGVPSLTNDRAALKAIGGIVKKCVNKAMSEFLSAELPAADDDDVLRQKYYNITDQNMVEMFQRWYWSRNYDVRKIIDSQNQKIEELETKLRMVQKVVC